MVVVLLKLYLYAAAAEEAVVIPLARLSLLVVVGLAAFASSLLFIFHYKPTKEEHNLFLNERKKKENLETRL